MSREIMQQALDAFEDLKKSVTRDGTVPENWDAYYEKEYYALEALRQAIEQAEKQEPVACKHKRYSNDVTEDIATCYDCGAEGRMRFVANYTAPPRKEFGDLLMKLHEKYKHQHNHFHVEAVNFWEKNNGV